jgi:pyruvate/2-oxoglutarate dehydrogenase complex dihydrolipoamide acyltransferase (E2) component
MQLPIESSLSFEFASNSKTDKLDNMRKRISEHMRYSLNTSAHVHIMNEVDMTDIVDFVKSEEDSFYPKKGLILLSHHLSFFH